MQISVFDFAQLHHFENKAEEALFEALADTDETELFEVRFVQALLEFTYPAIREPIIKWLMAPFILLLAIFCYYSIVHFEAVEDSYRELGHTTTFLMIEGFLIRICLLGLALYFMLNEITQIQRSKDLWDYFNDLWNLIDWAPLILLIISLLLSAVDQIRHMAINEIDIRVMHRNDLPDYEHATLHITQFQRYLNAIVCLFLWIKMYYFMRIQRNVAHLITTITEVLIDM